MHLGVPLAELLPLPHAVWCVGACAVQQLSADTASRDSQVPADPAMCVASSMGKQRASSGADNQGSTPQVLRQLPYSNRSTIKLQ